MKSTEIYAVWDWLLSPYFEGLTPCLRKSLYVEIGRLKVIKLKWGLEGGSWFNLTSHLIWRGNIDPERHRRRVRTEDRPCEDIARRWPSARQGERLQDKPHLLTPWLWTPDWEKGFLLLSHPLCGNLWLAAPANKYTNFSRLEFFVCTVE